MLPIRFLWLRPTVLVGACFLSVASVAATFTVNSQADRVDAVAGDGVCETSVDGECTLRAAVQEANAAEGGDSIELPAGQYQLSLAGRREDLSATGDLDISDDLIITGAGPGGSIIDANGIDRAFQIAPGASVSISGVTVQGGDLGDTGAFGDHGGGISNEGALTLVDAIVTGNTAGTFGSGGGILNRGTLDALNVSIIGNSAEQTGGIESSRIYTGSGAQITLTNVAILNNSSEAGIGGMVTGLGASLPGEPRDSAILTNVTMSGNVSGGCTSCAGGFSNLDDAALTNVTIADNQGAGIFGLIGPHTPVTSLKNTIVANNERDCMSPDELVSLGHNLDSDGSCGLIGTGDLSEANARLGTLKDNGGETLTHALLRGSPAIDAGSGDCPPPATDQRGLDRPVDGDEDDLAVCDIGAFEFVASSPGVMSEGVWADGNGNTYVVVEFAGRTWEEAEADVEVWLPGYHLATITSQEEQDFLNEMLTRNGLISQYWIGGQQVAPKPESDPALGWRWVTGEAWDYTNWSFSEPNDAGGIEDYLATSAYQGWNDEGTAVGSVGGYIAESGKRHGRLAALRQQAAEGKLEITATLRLDGTNQMAVLDVLGGQVLGQYEVPDPARAVESIFAFGDVNSGGLPDVGILGVGDSPVESTVFARASEDGGFIRNQRFFNEEWVSLDGIAMPDLSGGEHSDVAVLAANRVTGEIAAQIRDSVTGVFLRNVFYPAEPMQPHGLMLVPDFDTNPGPELGVLMTEESGRHIVMQKDAATGTFARNLFFLNANWAAVHAIVIPDLNGNAASEVGLLARNRTSGMLVVMLKDSASNTHLKNVFPFGSGWLPVKVVALPDENTNQAVELATLAVNGLSDKLVIQVRDALTGQFLRNLYPLGSKWQPLDVLALEDIGAGVPGLAILAIRRIDGVVVVHTINALSGDLVRNVFLN